MGLGTEAHGWLSGQGSAASPALSYVDHREGGWVLTQRAEKGKGRGCGAAQTGPPRTAQAQARA